jgi:predicted TIM-barrel fold metal-dependent hydrolase
MTAAGVIDVHQHIWPIEFIEALRRRRTSPRMVDWTLLLDGEPPYEVQPADHDLAARRVLETGTALALVSLSCALGIEGLPRDEAIGLIDAWHEGIRVLPEPFRGWASVVSRDPDLGGLRKLLAHDFVGLQVPAPALATPDRLTELAPLFELCQSMDRPVFIHPGRVDRADADQLPGWWPPVVDYVSQLHAAWWSWQAVGRSVAPELAVCFAAGAGLAPLHHERFARRGGHPVVNDARVFVDTSSYARQGLDSLVRVLGVDALVLGSDRPYAEPTDPALGEAATHAIQVVNPRNLLSLAAA